MAAPLGPRRRLYVEGAVAALGLVLFVLTLAVRNWIEVAFGVDPDAGNSSFEYLISVGLLAIVAIASILARSEWKRSRPGVTPG